MVEEAIKNHDLDALKDALENPSCEQQIRKKLVFYCAKYDFYEGIEDCIELGGDIEYRKNYDQFNETPLHTAAMQDYPEAFKKLLQLGADVNSKYYEFLTYVPPLQCNTLDAVIEGQSDDCLRILVESHFEFDARRLAKLASYVYNDFIDAEYLYSYYSKNMSDVNCNMTTKWKNGEFQVQKERKAVTEAMDTHFSSSDLLNYIGSFIHF